MYCRKCGNKINNEWKFCSNCGEELRHYINDNVDKKLEQEKHDEKIYMTIFGLGLLIFMLNFLDGCNTGIVGLLMMLCSIVPGFICCPHSKVLKVLFWTLLVLILIVMVILFIVAVFFTYQLISCCENFPG